MQNLKPISEMIDLGGKTVIVTGGALGIGYGIAYRLAEAHANVVIADLNEEAGNESVEKLKNIGWSAAFIKTDVSLELSVQQAIDFTMQTYGGLDVLVNNAGVYPIQPVMEMSIETFDNVLATNLKSVFLFTKFAGNKMIEQGRGGKIINITSVDAIHPSAVGLATYDASKHGMWGFTKNTALELAPHNIQVNAIAPGSIRTPGTGMDLPATPELEAIQKKFNDKIPMKRSGESDEIGTVALFLASEMSSYMTGAQIVVDGGVLLA